MIVTPVILDIDFLKSDLVRSPGLHASDIYSDLFSELEPNRFKRDSLPDPIRMAMGTAWEAHLEKLLILNGIPAERPEEFQAEGIAFSPDLLHFNSHVRLGEIKLTYLSSREMPTEAANTLPPKFEKFLVQMRLYCHLLDLNLARLYILFVCGDYTHPYTPELRTYDIEFSAKELQENFQMIKNHGKHMGRL
jgi:hypothetical protein